MRYALIFLLLAGCATPEEKADRAIANYSPYCEKLGYARDSDTWRQCIQTQVSDKRAAASRASAAALQSRPRTCQTVGNTVSCN